MLMKSYPLFGSCGTMYTGHDPSLLHGNNEQSKGLSHSGVCK